jgi:hypothetical protein
MVKFGRFFKALVLLLTLFLAAIQGFSQKKAADFVNSLGQLNYSSLDFWYARKVKESALLSGKTIDLFGVGKVDANSDFYDITLKDPKSPWGTTNIFSKMVLDIGNTRVIPEKRGNGYCCRLETKIRKDNIVGVKVDVLIAGTLFLGEMIEPVRSMKEPIKTVNQGIPFDRHPAAVKFDYKYHVGTKRVLATNDIEDFEGPDLSEFCVILQKRWEDKDGNIFATRIGGARQFFSGDVKEWINGAVFPITYGDITHRPDYDEKTMGLIPGVSEVYVKNSKNEVVPLIETGWGKENEMPTHMIMYFTSSYKGVDYVGSTETVFWVDNIELIY